jgi:K+-transporting ATPase A subunit
VVVVVASEVEVKFASVVVVVTPAKVVVVSTVAVVHEAKRSASATRNTTRRNMTSRLSAARDFE